jgi:hypothetical protein
LAFSFSCFVTLVVLLATGDDDPLATVDLEAAQKRFLEAAHPAVGVD